MGGNGVARLRTGWLGLLAAVAAGPAAALQINVGFTIAGATPMPYPAKAAGGGSLDALAAAAAQVWMASLGDYGAETVVNLGVGWYDTPSYPNVSVNNLAVTYGSPVGPSIIGTTSTRAILFNGNRTDWFVDATPYDRSEFAVRSTASVSYAGQSLETSDSFRASSGSAAFGRYDAFTVMMHEIGHAIGFGDYSSSPFDVGSVEIAAPAEFDGYVTPLTIAGGGHIAGGFSSALLYQFIGAGRRSLPSELDLVTVAEVVGYRVKDLDAPDRILGVFATVEEPPVAAAVPLPAGGALLGAGLLGLAGAARRRRAA